MSYTEEHSHEDNNFGSNKDNNVDLSANIIMEEDYIKQNNNLNYALRNVVILLIMVIVILLLKTMNIIDNTSTIVLILFTILTLNFLYYWDKNNLNWQTNPPSENTIENTETKNTETKNTDNKDVTDVSQNDITIQSTGFNSMLSNILGSVFSSTDISGNREMNTIKYIVDPESSSFAISFNDENNADVDVDVDVDVESDIINEDESWKTIYEVHPDTSPFTQCNDGSQLWQKYLGKHSLISQTVHESENGLLPGTQITADDYYNDEFIELIEFEIVPRTGGATITNFSIFIPDTTSENGFKNLLADAGVNVDLKLIKAQTSYNVGDNIKGISNTGSQWKEGTIVNVNDGGKNYDISFVDLPNTEQGILHENICIDEVNIMTTGDVLGGSFKNTDKLLQDISYNVDAFTFGILPDTADGRTNAIDKVRIDLGDAKNQYDIHKITFNTLDSLNGVTMKIMNGATKVHEQHTFNNELQLFRIYTTKIQDDPSNIDNATKTLTLQHIPTTGDEYALKKYSETQDPSNWDCEAFTNYNKESFISMKLIELERSATKNVENMKNKNKPICNDLV